LFKTLGVVFPRTVPAPAVSGKIIYDNGGTTPRKRNVGICVVCYDAFGTLQTDNIASVAYVFLS